MAGQLVQGSVGEDKVGVTGPDTRGPQWSASVHAKQGNDRSGSIAMLVYKIIGCYMDNRQSRAH